MFRYLTQAYKNSIIRKGLIKQRAAIRHKYITRTEKFKRKRMPVESYIKTNVLKG